MLKFENVLKDMDLAFFAHGKHKITAEKLFETEDAIFLDVRSNEEAESIAFPLRFQAECIHIPINEIPDRLSEIPNNKMIGVFCSAGIRAAIVYAFLKANGYNTIRIITDSCETLIHKLTPGEIWKAVK
jgi:rhodanese-related sulfurtransferase